MVGALEVDVARMRKKPRYGRCPDHGRSGSRLALGEHIGRSQAHHLVEGGVAGAPIAEGRHLRTVLGEIAEGRASICTGMRFDRPARPRPHYTGCAGDFIDRALAGRAPCTGGAADDGEDRDSMGRNSITASMARRAASVLVLSNSLGTNYELWAPQMDACAGPGFAFCVTTAADMGSQRVTPGPYTIERLGRERGSA